MTSYEVPIVCISAEWIGDSFRLLWKFRSIETAAEFCGLLNEALAPFREVKNGD